MLVLIEHSPNIYLDKIQKQLHEFHKVDVSLSTIWPTLKQLGIGLKKVHSSILHIQLTIITHHIVVEDGCWVMCRVTVNLYWRSGKNRPKTSCVLTKVQSTFSQCIIKMAGHIKECAHGSIAISFMGLGAAHVLSTIEKVLTFTQLLPPPRSYHWWSHLQSYQSRQL